MYFCLNFDTRKEHKANAMKFNKISFCPSAHSVLLSSFSRRGVFLDGMPE